MKKNLYYRTVYRRTARLEEEFLAFFFFVSSWPRLLLEVFLRRNFGERYFSFSSAIFMTLTLAALPFVISSFLSNGFLLQSPGYFLLFFGSWYLFLFAFLYMALRRRKEIQRQPSVFDLARFSLSAGVIDPRFRTFKWRGRTFGSRTIETVLEPGLCFLIGFGLWSIGQYIGGIIIISSIVYSLSYRAAYRRGDHFVMDKIDERIGNEELAKVFVDNRPTDETRGFAFYGGRPSDLEMRKQLMSSFIVEDEVVDVL